MKITKTEDFHIYRLSFYHEYKDEDGASRFLAADVAFQDNECVAVDFEVAPKLRGEDKLHIKEFLSFCSKLDSWIDEAQRIGVKENIPST